MKLYNANLSPYSSRVRIAIYAKNPPVEIVAPPGGLGSAEFEQVNPTGKHPAVARVLAEQGEAMAEQRTAGGR